jgi:hypothetical protein
MIGGRHRIGGVNGVRAGRIDICQPIKPGLVLPVVREIVGPSLTAAVRDGRTRRAKCRQIRYPDPKLSTVHETGASPLLDREGRPSPGSGLFDIVKRFTAAGAIGRTDQQPEHRGSVAQRKGPPAKHASGRSLGRKRPRRAPLQ